MRSLAPFIIVGLATGSVYGIAAMGLVVTYKTSGVFNFAHGAIGTVAAYTFYELRDQRSMAWPIAAVISVVVVGAVAGLLLERLARRLSEVDLAVNVVATVGLLVAVQGLALAWYGAAARDVPPFLPTGRFTILDVSVGYDQLILFGLALGAALFLSVFFRRTRLGVAMRGVVDDPNLLALAATDPAKVRRWGWIIGSSFAATSGILLVPTIGLDASLLTLLVVQAFGAAALGAFSSVPLSYVGGLGVGIAAAVSTKYVATVPSLAGLPPSVPFLVLFVTLLALPKHRLVDMAVRRRRSSRPQTVLPAPLRLSGYGIVAVALSIVPFVVGARLPAFTSALIFAVVFASLRLLVRVSGQVSLCHAAFVAVGAATFANLSHGPDVPWLLALLAAGAIAVPVGAFVAIPSIRLSGVYLAVATFGFGILIERIFYGTALMFGRNGSRLAPRPDLPGVDLGSDTGYYFTVLVILTAVLIVTLAIQRSRLGRLLAGLSGSPLALETNGASVNVTKVIVFCISAFMAGIAGGLFASLHGSINGNGFHSFESLTWIAILLLAGSGPVTASLAAGAMVAVVPVYLDGPTVSEYLPVLFGASAVLVAARAARHGRGSEVLTKLAERSAERPGRGPVLERAMRFRQQPAGGTP